jgi:hypothetical protein
VLELPSGGIPEQHRRPGSRDPPPIRAGELEYEPWGEGAPASGAAAARARGGGGASDLFWPTEGRAVVGTAVQADYQAVEGKEYRREKEARKKKGLRESKKIREILTGGSHLS